MSDNKYMEPEFSPVPPPIQPIVGVPGGNVQEQMGFLANKTNECIQRWNQIQAKCYESMNKAVGAAVSNDVYYEPDEVHFCTGYSENDSAAYEYVEIKPVDRAGNPIKVNLALAYNNTSNSQVVQSIEDVSFLNNSNAIITAVSPDVGGWQGTSMQGGNPIATAEVSDAYVAGFNKNGALRIFASDVDLTVLYQNQMQDVIGPVTPILIDGAITEQAQAMTTPGSITAIGYKSSNGMKVFFSVGAQEYPGMQGVTVAQILQSMGCTTAVITSFLENGIIAEHKTNGMEFLGKITNAPLGWQIPYNCAFWQVSKRPEPGWKNKFTAEIADLVQLYGHTSNDLEALQNEMDIANLNIANLDTRMTAAEGRLDDHDAKLDELDNRLTIAENDIDALEVRMQAAEDDIDQLQTDLANEIARSTAKDEEHDSLIAGLREDLTQETADRIAADENLQEQITELDNELQQEIADRTAADATLQIAINDEAIERANADLELARQIADEVANRTEGDQILQDQITAMVNGSTTLPYVRRAGDTMSGDLYMNGNLIHTVGDAVETGDAVNLGQLQEVDDKVQSILDGTAEIGYVRRSGDTMSGELNMGGNTISNVANASANSDAVNLGQLEAVQDGLEEQITDILNGSTSLPYVQRSGDTMSGELNMGSNKITSVANGTASGDAVNFGQLEAVEDDLQGQIDDILDGTSPVPSSYELPIASTTELGGIKVGANLTIQSDGTLDATGGGEAYVGGDGITISGETVSVDDTVARTSDITELESDIDTLGGRVTTAETDIDNLETAVAVKADASDLNNYLRLSGGTMSGNINMNSHSIFTSEISRWASSTPSASVSLTSSSISLNVGTNDASYTIVANSDGRLSGLQNATNTNDAVILSQLNEVESDLQDQIDSLNSSKADVSALDDYLPLSGGTMTGNIDLSFAGEVDYSQDLYSDNAASIHNLTHQLETRSMLRMGTSQYFSSSQYSNIAISLSSSSTSYGENYGIAALFSFLDSNRRVVRTEWLFCHSMGSFNSDLLTYTYYSSSSSGEIHVYNPDSEYYGYYMLRFTTWAQSSWLASSASLSNLPTSNTDDIIEVV